MESKTSSKNHARRPSPLSSSDAGVTVRRRRRARNSDVNDDNHDDVQKESGNMRLSSKEWNVDSKMSEDLAQFRKSALVTSQASFWSKTNATTLMKHVVLSSFSLFQKKDCSSSLLLEGDSSELFSSCRALVKEATEEDKRHNEGKIQDEDAIEFHRMQYHRLFVSTHGLRALLCTQTINDGGKRDAILRLFYFCIATAASSLSSTDTLNDSLYICCVAYHALANILQNYLLSGKDVAFTCKTAVPTHSCFTLTFPIPALSKRKAGVNKNSTHADQICTMCIAANLSMARIVSRLVRDKADNGENCGFQQYPVTAIDDPTEFLRYIVLDVTVPWIACLSKLFCVGNKNEPRQQTTILSNCKKAHRVLVDAADMRQDHVEGRLKLQAFAVFALLLNQKVAASVLVPDASSEHSVFALACTFAWKVSESAFAKLTRNDATRRSSSLILKTFHGSIGALLDSFTEELAMYPFSYIEYCAYRALHTHEGHTSSCKGTGCIFRGTPYRFQHSCSLQWSPNWNESFLALFFLACHACRSLESVLSNQHAPIAELESLQENQIFSAFRLHFVDGNDDDIASRLRCYNMFSSLSLHRVVYRILNENHDGVKPKELLNFSGKILSDCIGPFYFSLLHHVNEKQRRQLWPNMASCFHQAISVEELNMNSNSLERSNMVSEELLRNLLMIPNQTVHVPMKFQPQSECVENSAKFLYSVGKKRFEGGRTLDSLPPLLYSVRILVHLTTAMASDEIPNLKISNRFTLISSIYKSHNMVDEAIIATLMALFFDAVEVSFTATTSSNSTSSLFLRLASMTENIVDAGFDVTNNKGSEHRIGLQSSYINLFLKRTNVKQQFDVTWKNNVSGLTPTKAIDFLLASRNRPNACETFEQYCRVPFNVGSLMKSVFSCQTAMSSFTKNYQVSFQIELLEIALDTMVKVGSILQRKERVMSSVNVSDHTALCLLAESLLHVTSRNGALNAEMMSAMINIIASVSLVSSQSHVNLESMLLSQVYAIRRKEAPFLNLAQDFATKAKTVLGKAFEKQIDMDPIVFAVDLALDLYLYQLSCMCLDQRTSFQLDFKRLQSFMADVQVRAKKESIASAWIPCLCSTLSKLCGMFSLEGEGLLSLQLSKWEHDAMSTSCCDNDSQIWSESVFLSTISTNSVVALTEFESVSCSTPFEALIQSCRLRLFIRSLNEKESLLDSRHRFHAILDNLKESDSEDAQGFVVQCIVLWTRSTIFLGLSECMERQGLLQMSRSYARYSFESCKILSTHMKRNKAALSFGARSHLFWMRFSVPLISLHCAQRQTECLLQIANLQSRLGDYRQSVDHSFSALITPDLEAVGFDVKKTFAESVTLTKTYPAWTSHEAFCRRVFLRFKSKASPIDLVTDVFRAPEDSLFLSRFDGSMGPGDVFVNRELEKIIDLYEIVDMRNGYQAFPTPMSGTALHKSATKVFIRHLLAPQVSKIYETVTSVVGRGEQPYLQLQYDAKLRDASTVLSRDSNDSLEASATATGWLHDIVSAPNCAPLCRSWSYYLLGSLSLKSARTKGDLRRIWNNLEPSTNFSQSLYDAKCYFENALSLLGSSCEILKRNVLRSLALVTGPGDSNNVEAVECFRLINASAGGSTKTRMLGLTRMAGECGDPLKGETKDIVNDIFESLERSAPEKDDSRATAWFIHQLGKFVPKGWRFVTAVLCPSGEMLLSSLDFSECGDPVYNNACVNEDWFKEIEISSRVDLYDFIVKPLKEIIHRSQAQLSGNDNIHAHDESSRQDHTRRWWNTRKDLDSDLQVHIETVERKLFSSEDVRRVFCGLSSDGGNNDFADEGFHSTRGNLTSRFEAVSLADDGNKPSSSRGPHESTHGMIETTANRISKNTRFDRTNSSYGGTPNPIDELKNECTFLILDENLLVFPFEGFECFEGRALSRIPSLPFLLAKFVKDGVERYHPTLVQPEKTSYILDPESNLAGTKDRLTPFISSLEEKYENGWRGIVGESPSNEFMEDVLSQRDGLLLYFGHGGGQQFFSRAKIESLGQRCDYSLASLILMGCGSGRLESVNTKKSKSIAKLPIHYEPEGIALSYLFSGAPCVVGNLWDVTDRDIDRYSIALVQSIFDGSGDKSIAQCVAASRAACKMRYIVGCAPVCYGIPVITPKQKS